MEVSYVLSYKLAKKSKPLTVGTFLKDCMEEAASILCPDNKGQSHSHSACGGKRIGCSSQKRCLTFYIVALDESTHIKDTAQLLIFNWRNQ